MTKQTYEVKVPPRMVVVDVNGCRVGAGKTAKLDSAEKTRVEKFIEAEKSKIEKQKPKEVKDANN